MKAASDEKQIRQVFEELTIAWNEGKSNDYLSHFTDASDYVTKEGNYLHGKKAMAEYLQQLFNGRFKSNQVINEVEHLRFISPEVVLIHCTITTFVWKDGAPVTQQSASNAIAVKQEGEWKLEALHHCAIAKSGPKSERSAVQSFNKLLVA